jgi:hypothetical protein
LAVVLMLGAGSLASLMAAGRDELERKRASSRVAYGPNASVADLSSSPAAEAASLAQKRPELARERGLMARLAFPNNER